MLLKLIHGNFLESHGLYGNVKTISKDSFQIIETESSSFTDQFALFPRSRNRARSLTLEYERYLSLCYHICWV